jgi:hypothetical protein
VKYTKATVHVNRQSRGFGELMSVMAMFHQLTDFCADQNRGFAGSNALIALQ